MALQAAPGKKFKITVKGAVTRASAQKTLERLFMKDKVIAAPVVERESHFTDLPKRRGGRIWTKYSNKLHPKIVAGTTATIIASAQHAKDLDSVAAFVDVSVA
jgi:hypothetical protein